MRILICLLFSIVAVDFATAACKINLRVKNETEYAISLEDTARVPVSESFQVKTRAVPWRSVGKGGWSWVTNGGTQDVMRDRGTDSARTYSILASGKTAVDNYEAVLGCEVKRRYRIDFTCYEVEPWPHYQDRLQFKSTGGIATKTRYFPGPKQWTESRNVTIPIKSCK